MWLQPMGKDAAFIHQSRGLQTLLLSSALPHNAAHQPPRGELGAGHLLAQKTMSSHFLGMRSKSMQPSGSYLLFPDLFPRTPCMSLLCQSNWNVHHSLNPLCGFLLVCLCPGCPMIQGNISYTPSSCFAIQMLLRSFHF